MTLVVIVAVIGFTACKKDVAMPTPSSPIDNPQNTAALAKQIEDNVGNFKKNFLDKQSSVVGDGNSMEVAEAIEMIETDLNYTYAETNVAEGIVNTPFTYNFPISLPSNGVWSAEYIYNVYHATLNAIITTNNELTDPEKQLTWVDIELAIGQDGNNEVIVTYLFSMGGPTHIGPGPLQSFSYPGYWHWNFGGVATALGYFNAFNDITSINNNNIGGAVGLIQAAAQNNFNQLQWQHNHLGYYVGNLTINNINLVSSPYYTNTQITAWRTLAYQPGLQNTFALNTSATANIYPEATYRAHFQEPYPTSANPPNGYYWLFERECLPDYALNFYTERIVDLARDIMPTTGIITANQGVFSFNVGGVAGHQTVIVNPPNSIDEVQLNHSIHLNIGTYVGYPKTLSPLPGTLTATPM